MNIRLLAVCAMALLSGCAVARPMGPSIMVLPGQGKSFDAFRADDYNCRNQAAQSIGYQAQGASQASEQNGAAAAVSGTAIGAAAGAAIGAAAGNAGAGAAIGAGTGLAIGATQGAAMAQDTAGELQWRYDTTYAQCMAAMGNQVPTLPPASVYSYPPPPAGYYTYMPYPPAYAFYPGYGYVYPPVTFFFGFGGGGGWGGGGWHGHPHGGGGGWHGPPPGGGGFGPPHGPHH